MMRSCAAVFGVLLCMAALAGCQPVAQAPVTARPPLPELRQNNTVAVVRAQRALADGRLGAARDGFSAALRSSPNDVAAGLGLAETYLALKDFSTAQRVFEATSRHAAGRDWGRVSQGFGLIALNGEDLAAARQHLTRAVKADDSLWRAWVGLGRLHARAGERDSARVAFARAEAAAPSLGRVMNDIGMSYVLERQPKAAVPYLERALVADPLLDLARGNLRIARAMVGQYDLAIAGAPQEELPNALNNVGYIAVVNGDFEVADRFLRRALEVSPTYHSAAAANLNLLAHAQRSGRRPGIQGRLASATATAARESLPTPAKAGRDKTGQYKTGRVKAGRAAVSDPVARAATRNGPIPESTGNVGFRLNVATRTAQVTPVEGTIVPPPKLAPTGGTLSHDVSDSEDLAEFTWDSARIVDQGPEAEQETSAGAETMQPRIEVSDEVETVAFQWVDPNARPKQEKAEAEVLASTQDSSLRDDGFLWKRCPTTGSCE